MIEADWKVFRAIIPALRERYLRKRRESLLALLSAPGKTETERFWAAEERVCHEAQILQECFDDLRRSRLFERLLSMRSHGMLADEDLGQFSEELQDKLREFDREG